MRHGPRVSRGCGSRCESLERRLLLNAYYVAPWGSDLASGAADAPWQTLQHAANAVEAGDIVTVRPGQYQGFNLGWERVHAGTPDAPIVFRADPGAVISSAGFGSTDGISIQDGSNYVIIDGFTIDNASGTIVHAGIRVARSHHVTIRNNTIDQCGWWGIFTSFAYDVLIENNIVSRAAYQHGIYVSNSGDRPVIRRNTVFANRMAGIHMNGDYFAGGDGIISGAIVEYNVLFDNGAAGGAAINADGVQDSIFRHNLAYNNHAGGITLYATDGADGSRRNTVINNTFVNAHDSRWVVKIADYSTANTLLNNIFFNHSDGRGAINISPESMPGFVSDYNIVDDRFTLDDETVIEMAQWNSITHQDRHSIIATPGQLFVDPDAGDFRLKPGSPAIDAGSPASYYLREPFPNGARIDAGAYGNTPLATPSPAQLVQVLSPGNGERIEQGQLISIAWRSDGLTPVRPVALINAGSTAAVGRWLGNAYQTAGQAAGAITGSIDASAVVDPAPDEVYRTYAAAEPGVGQRLAWSLPVPDGAYTLRLHLVEPEFHAAGQRRFEIRLQGASAGSFDIAEVTVSPNKATVATFTVSATDGAGVLIELVNLTGNPAVLSAIELTQQQPGNEPSPTTDVELSADGGQSWKMLAVGVLADRFGDGSFLWSADQTTDSALIRVSTSDGAVRGVSRFQFFLVNDGPYYYINDYFRTGDVFTTRGGHDAYSGKSPDRPMASLAALLGAYDLDPGDIIYVDTGKYNLTNNIVITADDSGVRIQGPADDVARISRKSTYRGSYAFELQDADNITIDRISIVVAEIGIHASASSDSDYLTVTNSRIYANRSYGIFLDASNDHATLSGNILYGFPEDGPGEDQLVGIAVAGSDALITGNTLYNHAADGIRATGPDVVVSNNTAYGNHATGIYVAGGTVTGNTVYNNLIGIALTHRAVASGNTVYGNYDGIVTADSAGPGPFSFWNDATPATGTPDPIPQPVEIGVKFRADIPGRVTAIRFHKATENTGTHVGHIWTRDGQLLASATFTSETDSGWQTVLLDPPVPIDANTTYVASYYAPDGGYVVAERFFAQVGVDSGPLHALANGDDGANGVFVYGEGGGFPDNPYEAGNYWVDVVFVPDLSRAPDDANTAVITSNRAYDNSHVGIIALNDSTVTGNIVYSNRRGIDLADFSGHADSNLVYANDDCGVSLAAANGPVLAGNTIYQPAGDAIRIEAGSRNLSLRNNILVAAAGYAIRVAPDSQSGFSSDYNIIHTAGNAAAHAAFWNNATVHGLSDWQQATSFDSHSTDADPAFVLPAGADGVLGHGGGEDDNFHPAARSPAIDHAQSWASPAVDLDGMSRADDPGTSNTGSPDYMLTPLASSPFSVSGVAQTWHGVAASWHLSLPFAFPFFGTFYSSVRVASAGYLCFADASPPNAGSFTDYPIIAPLWADLRTDTPTTDIHIDSSVPGQVTIRWAAVSNAGQPANFAAVLFPDGRIRFDYGDGNIGLNPTVGISAGDRQHSLLASYTGRSDLANANSIQFTLASGFVDLGAYEFRGDSTDTTPPAILATDPPAIRAGASYNAPLTAITLTFTEPVDPIGALRPASYRLVAAGPDRLFDTSDDTLVTTAPARGADPATIILALPAGPLPIGQYRLVVSTAINDLAGVRLDGDGDQQPGGEFIRAFHLDPPPVSGTTGDDKFHVRLDPDDPATIQVFLNALVTATPTLTLPMWAVQALVFNSGAGRDRFIVDFTGGNPIPPGGLLVNGTPAAGDLVLIGDATLDATYLPAPVAAGPSAIRIGQRDIRFTGLQGVLAYSFASFALLTPNPADILTVDRPDAGQTRVTGSSGNVPILPLGLFDTDLLSIDAGANDQTTGDDSITIGPGDLSANGLALLILDAGAGANTLTIRNATVNLHSFNGANLALIANASMVVPHASQEYASVNIVGPARVTLLPGGASALHTHSLTIGNEGAIDLADNALVLHATPENRGALLQRATSYFQSGQLYSSLATAYTTLAISPNDNGTGLPFTDQLAGIPVTVNDILVKFTYKGDANFDGVVNADDYFQIDQGYISQKTSWYNGDFNYDQAINADDYFLIDSAFIAQASPLRASVFRAAAPFARLFAEPDLLGRARDPFRP